MAPSGPGSISSGAPSSEGGGSAASNETLGVLGRGDGDADADVLLRGNSSSKKETFFGVLFYIYTNRYLPTDWRYVILATVLQWVQLLILFFGPSFGWDVDWQGNNFWRFYKRLQLQNAITERGFEVYQGVLFGGTALILLLLAVVLWLHFALRTKTKFRWQWPSHLLRIVICIVFTTLQTSYLLLFTVAFNCNSKALGFTNYYFPDKACFAMPPVALLGLSIFMALLFTVLSALFALIETGASEPLSRNFLSLSAGNHFIVRRCIKFILPLVPVALKTVPRWEGWVNLLLTTWYLYLTIRRVPYHRTYLNITEAFLYSWCWYASGLGLIGIYYPRYWPGLTTAFLAGMGPVGVCCGLLSYWRLKRMWRIAMMFERWTPQLEKRQVYRFFDQEEVEVAARVCHKLMKTPTLDWVPIPLWVQCAANVLHAGLVQFPDSAYLNIALGTFEAVLRQEPSCYVREQEKLAKKTKESDSSAILDATSWAEYQANYRAVIRAHKAALSALKSFWQLLLHSDVSMTRLQRNFLKIEKARMAAERAYRAVMERYPNNPRIMRAYSRFLQQIKNDPHGSTRYAASADRIEQRQNEARQETIFAQIIDRTFKDAAAEKMMAMIDETSDAVCIINLEGLVQHVNDPFLRLFGYRKGELEGCNVSRIMPNPFSAQHDSYLRNYATSRCPKILDTTREVVALHKHRFVFGVNLCVTPVNLGGSECFMGVIHSIQDDDRVATAYCTSSGTIVCVSRGFGNVLAYSSEDIIGKSLHTLCSNSEKVSQILNEILNSNMGQMYEFGEITVVHRFGEELKVVCRGSRAGTDGVRVAKIHLQHNDRYSGLLCVNPVSSRVVYANSTLSDLLGYSSEQLIKMRLHELMPEPYAQLHQRFIKGRDLSRCPGLKCRSGRVVEFKSKAGKLVPVLMDLTERATENGNVFSVKVAPVASKEEAEYNRVTLLVDAKGVIVGPPQGNTTILSLDNEDVAGKPLSHFLDLYRRDSREVAEVHAELVSKTRSKEVTSFRVAAAIRGKRTVPCVLSLVLPEADDGSGAATSGPATMHLYRSDYLEGILELDSSCKIKKASEEACLIFGQPPGQLVGEHIQKVLPRACPSGKTSELLVARGQKGGSKRSIGSPGNFEGAHPDGKSLHISLQASESTERPGRFLARIIVPRPISAVAALLTDGGAAGAACVSSAVGGILQPGLYSASREAGQVAAAAGPAAHSGVNPPPGCPFHRAMSGGSSLLQRLGVGGSRPASSVAAAPPLQMPRARSGCPVNHDTGSVLAGLTFPPGSQFADPAAAAQAAADIVAAAPRSPSRLMQSSAGDVTRPTTQGGLSGIAASGPQEQAVEDVVGCGSSVQQKGEGPEDRSMGVSSEDEQAAQEASGSAGEADAAGGAAGGEDDMDPAELAAKMERVQNWLSEQRAGEAAVTGAPAAAGDGTGVVAVHTRGKSGGSLLDQAGGRAIAAAAVKQLPLNKMPDVALAVEDGGPVADGAMEKAGSVAEDSSMGGSDSTGVDGGTVDDGADFGRLKRFKKAYKLLNSGRSRQAINNLQARLKYLLAVLVAVHVGCFAASLLLLDSSMVYIHQIDQAGQAARNSVSALTDVRNMQYAGVEMSEFGEVRLFPQQNVSAANILSKVALFESFQETLFFKRSAAAKSTRDYYTNTMLNITEFADLEGGVEARPTQMSLWEASQRALNAFRSVAAVPGEYALNMTGFADWQFLMANIPELISVKLISATDLQTRLAVGRLRSIISATWGLLGCESVFIPLVAAYLFWLLRQVALERFRLFAVFLYVPRPAVLAQARAQVEADDLGDGSDDEEDAEGMNTASTAVNMQLSARTLAQRAAQDKLAMSRKKLWWMMSPMAVWMLVVLVAWLLQYNWISSAEERVMGVNASERIFIYNARTRFFANELTVVGNELFEDNDHSLYLRGQLELAATRLKFYHETVLYGSHNDYRPLDNAHHNLAGMNFISTLFSNPARNHLLYERHVCHRTNPATCLTRDNSLYWTSNMGMDSLLYHTVEVAHTLANDDMAAINVFHPSVKFIKEVASNDGVNMYMASNAIFLFISNFMYTKVIQGCALGFAVAGALFYLWFIAKPYFIKTQAEARKVAELLSYLQGVDVGALMGAVNGQGGGQGLALAGRTSSRSSDAETDSGAG